MPGSATRSWRLGWESRRRANDFLVHVAVRDADHLREFALEAFTNRPEVARIETGLIFEYVASPKLPILIDPE